VAEEMSGVAFLFITVGDGRRESGDEPDGMKETVRLKREQPLFLEVLTLLERTGEQPDVGEGEGLDGVRGGGGGEEKWGEQKTESRKEKSEVNHG
jgi:hypothetical protein